MSPARADELFSRFQRTGDPACLGAVYDLVAPELLRVAHHLTRDSASAEDALQATFVTAIERASSFDSTRRVLPWLVGILANHAKAARARADRVPDPQSVRRGDTESPAIAAELAELDARLDEALARLPETYRPVLVLRVRHGLSATEIAHALGRPSGTVRSELARGIELLRRVLPASFAGAGIVSLASSARGLGAVREAVLAHAAAAHAPLAITATVAGALAMKKVVASTVVLVLACVLWSSWGAESEQEKPRDVAVGELASDLDATARPRSNAQPTLESSAPAGRERAGTAQPIAEHAVHAAPVATAMLRVRALHTEGGAPARDEPVRDEVVLVRSQADASYADEWLAASTDESGEAHFAELLPGRARVRLLRGGEREVELAAGRESAIEIRVHAGVLVRGRVVDERREPVGGAEIWLSERYRTNLGHVIARADDEGRFAIRSVGVDQFLAARARGFATSALERARATPGDEVEIELVLARASAPVRGRVLDEGGAPISSARVLLGDEIPKLSAPRADGTVEYLAPPLRASTDEHGEFAFDDAPLGTLAMQVRARGHAPHASTITVDADRRAFAHEIRLDREARIEGEVRDELGRRVPHAWIQAGQVDRFSSATAWAGTDGTFSLGGLAPGDARIVAQTGGGQRAELEVRLAAGEVRRWDVVLASTPVISGTLVDEHGEALTGWAIVAVPRGDPAARVRSSPTDSGGAFTIADVQDEEHTLWVQRPSGWRAFPSLIVGDVRPSRAPLHIRLPPAHERGGRLIATVLGPDRGPVSGVDLQVWNEDHKMWRSFAVDGESGKLEVEDVPSGTCMIDVRHAAYPWIQVGVREFAPGVTVDLGEIVLADGGHVRGRILGVAEGLLAGVQAMVNDASNRMSGGVAISNGEFRTAALAPGKHVIVFRGDSVSTQRVEVDVQAGVETTRDVSLASSGSRRVTMELPGGAPRPQWISISVYARDGTVAWSGGVGPEGPLEVLVSVQPGSYELWAASHGGLEYRGAFVVERDDGSDPPARVRLEAKR